MKSFAAFSLFVSVAFASAIPSGISSGCSDYLTKLDSDTTLQSCTSSLIKATSSFAPGSSGGDVTAALNGLCGSDSACSEPTIRSTLANFYGACQPELSSNLNQDVLKIYDILYTLLPLKEATCAKDDSGKFCATEITGSAPSASSLFSGSQQALAPNFDTLESSNAAFLFLKPDLSSDKLCTSCARSIITSYISWESDIAYAPGISQSILLNGQPELYAGVQKTCGANFLSGAVQAAGSLSNGILGNHVSGAPRTVGAAAGGIASLLGAVTVALAATL